MGKVVVAGIGMVPFAKPGRSESYTAMGERAARLALGFEQMVPSALQSHWTDRPWPLDGACVVTLYQAG